MADDLILTQYSAWTDNIWFDQTTGSLVPAGSDNDLTIATGVGGVMTGTVQADSLTVAEPYPGFGFLAVWSGLKRPPLASLSHATHLPPFLCSAERGRFFVPA